MPHTTEEELRNTIIEKLDEYHENGEWHYYTELEKQRHADVILALLRSTILSCEPKKENPEIYTHIASRDQAKGYNAALAAYTANIVKVLGGKDENLPRQ